MKGTFTPKDTFTSAQPTLQGTSLTLSQRVQVRWLAWSRRDDARAAFVATLALRLLCSALALLLALLFPQAVPIPGGLTQYVTAPWLHWDTTWYLGITRDGYARYGSTAFLPLYPLLIRAVGVLLGGHVLSASLLIATISTFGALLCLYRLVERLSVLPGAARWALVVAALVPVSFFLMAGYTEALFLWLALAAMLAALDGRWARFALVAALAALTRHQGVLLSLLLAPTLLARVKDWLRAGWRQPAWGAKVHTWGAAFRPLAGPLLAALAGPVAYVLWLLVVGVVLRAPLPWQPLGAANGWNLHYVWPGAGILADLAAVVRGNIPIPLGAAVPLDAVAALVSGVVLLLGARRLPLGLTLYLIGCWCLALMKVQAAGLTISAARYLLLLLPLALLPGEWLAKGHPLLRVAWVMGAGVALVALTWAFVHGGWIS